MERFPNIREAAQYSNEILARLRSYLTQNLANDDVTVVTGGSFGRKEASGESDLDFFVICDKGCTDEVAVMAVANDASERIVGKPPSNDGPFAQPQCGEDLLKHIGGSGDSNDNITRRILFLLESEWLYNEDKRLYYIDRLLEIYIKEDITDHQLAMFF